MHGLFSFFFCIFVTKILVLERELGKENEGKGGKDKGGEERADSGRDIGIEGEGK